MEPRFSFRICPRCGRRQKADRQRPLFHCAGCDFCYYFNPTVAVAGIVTDNAGRVLMIRRAKQPGKGKLAMPGGFVDFHETAEEALQREMREEVGVKLSGIEFLCSHPNRYPYKGLTYVTLDLFFVAKPRSVRALALEDVASVDWLKPEQVKPADLAFPSMRQAWKCWVGQNRAKRVEARA